jgi:hypothetical protein
MRMSDDKSKRSAPPDGDDDWRYIWEGTDKGHRSWIIAGPLYALVTYWKAFAVMIVVILALNSDRIMTAIEALAGVPK